MYEEKPSVKFPAKKTALAFIEYILPKGDIIDEVDSTEILESMNTVLSKNFTLPLVLFLFLWVLEIRTLFSTGKLYRSLSYEQRLTLHSKWMDKKVTRLYVRGLSLVFKLAYTLNETTLEKAGSHNGIKIPVAEKERWDSNIFKASDLDETEEVYADVVIVGTGAGGASAAYELARRGLGVAIIEEGNYYDRSDFDGNIINMLRKLYRNMGETGTIGNAIIPMPLGKNVGGTTTINSGTCMRTPASVLETWQQEGLTDLTEKEMEPYFKEVETILKVQPAESKYVGPIGEVVKKGADALGYTKNGPLIRNADGCDGQGLCQFGCPSGAKQSTNVSYIPLALQEGASLYTQIKVKRLLRKGNEIQGVVGYGKNADGKSVKIIVKARKTIISMGSVYTPDFLKYNGIKSPLLGKNLSIHPSGVLTALYKDVNFNHSNSIPQGYGVHDLADEGLMFEGGTPPFLVHSVTSPHVGKSYVYETERFQHTAYFGFMIKDSSRGKITSLPILGFPLIRYNMNKQDFKLFLRGIETLGKIHLKSGVDALYVTGNPKYKPIHNEQELEALLNNNLKPTDFLLSAYHPLGTCRLGASKKLGVCDSDHKVFGYENLYVMDGSNVPSSLGANPQVTIMSLTTRASRKLAERLLCESTEITA